MEHDQLLCLCPHPSGHAPGIIKPRAVSQALMQSHSYWLESIQSLSNAFGSNDTWLVSPRFDRYHSDSLGSILRPIQILMDWHSWFSVYTLKGVGWCDVEGTESKLQDSSKRIGRCHAQKIGSNIRLHTGVDPNLGSTRSGHDPTRNLQNTSICHGLQILQEETEEPYLSCRYLCVSISRNNFWALRIYRI